MVIGDLNYDMLKSGKRKHVDHLMDTFSLSNLDDKPTCSMKNCSPSLIDLILTNSSYLFCNTTLVNCCISDCHCLILTSLREQVESVKRKRVTFRSYKNFDENKFNEEILNIPLQVAHVFDDIDDLAHDTLVKQIVDEHAPIQHIYPIKNLPPYMNSEYRKCIYKTRQAHITFLK